MSSSFLCWALVLGGAMRNSAIPDPMCRLRVRLLPKGRRFAIWLAAVAVSTIAVSLHASFAQPAAQKPKLVPHALIQVHCGCQPHDSGKVKLGMKILFGKAPDYKLPSVQEFEAEYKQLKKKVKDDLTQCAENQKVCWPLGFPKLMGSAFTCPAPGTPTMVDPIKVSFTSTMLYVRTEAALINHLVIPGINNMIFWMNLVSDPPNGGIAFGNGWDFTYNTLMRHANVNVRELARRLHWQRRIFYGLLTVDNNAPNAAGTVDDVFFRGYSEALRTQRFLLGLFGITIPQFQFANMKQLEAFFNSQGIQLREISLTAEGEVPAFTCPVNAANITSTTPDPALVVQGAGSVPPTGDPQTTSTLSISSTDMPAVTTSNDEQFVAFPPNGTAGTLVLQGETLATDLLDVMSLTSGQPILGVPSFRLPLTVQPSVLPTEVLAAPIAPQEGQIPIIDSNAGTSSSSDMLLNQSETKVLSSQNSGSD